MTTRADCQPRTAARFKAAGFGLNSFQRAKPRRHRYIGSCGDDAESSRKPQLLPGRAPNSPPLLDMKVQQGCNSANMGIPVTTEEELRRNTVITPEDVLGLQKITKRIEELHILIPPERQSYEIQQKESIGGGLRTQPKGSFLSFPDYLCSPEENVHMIDFTRFKIRDMETGTVLFEITKPPTPAGGKKHCDPNAGRFVRYQFTPAFLQLRQEGRRHVSNVNNIVIILMTNKEVEFTVGDTPINNFRMIERHYFRDQLLKSFDFEFGFCMPSSKNTCEHIYEFPALSEEIMREMILHPYETQSDSFYFVDNKLVMHNKADYSYSGGP
ncbi:hypothetical protein L3Q82_018851 [Scortum barcoo]|uniref:Uncharacterized protein n=1 Tax=Scortum barcoo TaxID=214431 RepID=A0ACB8VG18_9TELE|nr:hypothetical protein L3Q82_018851 [Scortum barcoo]